MQIKSEDKILGDVLVALRGVAGIATHAQGSYKSLQSKQDLLQILIENERSRLRVWLFPLESERKHPGSKNAEVYPIHSLLNSLVLTFDIRELRLSCGWRGLRVQAWLSSWPLASLLPR